MGGLINIMNLTCIFCSIIQKDIPSHILYEDEKVICILDKYPISIGHFLVIPKNHSEEFYDVEDETLARVMKVAKNIGYKVAQLYNADGMTFMQNNGVFKDVPHYHLHGFPRFKNDGFKWIEPNYEPTEEELYETFQSINNLL